MMKRCILLAFLLLGLAAGNSRAMTVTNLCCEYRTNPLGVDVAQPRLGWTLESSRRGERQTGYQVLAASSQGLLEQNKGDLWDSGQVSSHAQNQIHYGGAALTNHQQVFWKVRAWDGASSPSAWSPSATWTMGVLTPGGWQAQWISFGNADARSTMLRRGFGVRPELKRALANVCGLGQYEMRLNGTRVGSDFLSPGWTKYDKTALYDTWDVTALLTPGTNAVGLLLGNGMYNVPEGTGRYVKFTGSFGPRQAIAQIRLEYNDGSVQVLGTDASWKATTNGPTTFNTIYGGEDYDARLEQAGWDTAAFNDSVWSNAMVTAGPGGVLKGTSCAAPPLRTQEVFTPVNSWSNGAGNRVYDFGQNAAMIPTIVAHGPAGSTVRVYTSELIHADGSLNPIVSQSYVTYTLKGGGPETFTPRFFYIGCRYARVELRDAAGGTGGALPVLDTLTSTAVSSASEQVGSFVCSKELFNRVRTLIKWAQRNNSVSLISDCPQREKLGWLEQYHLHGPSLRYEEDYAALYAKGESDMADSQLASGLVPDVAPEYIVFDGDFRDSPEWGSACVLVPAQQYEFYGDTELFARYYNLLKRYVDYLTSKSADGIVNHGLGDWYDMGPGGLGVAQLTPLSLTATAIYYADVKVIAQAAALLGKTADATAYGALASKIYSAFNARFYDAAAGSYATGSQTADAMPLVLGLVPETNRARVVTALVDDVRARGYSLTAGDVGHRFLLRALADAGRSDVIFDLHTRTNTPGYGYILNRGATSLTEGWDGSESQDHFMLGHIMEWFYHDLAGIQADPSAPGFEKIIIKPTVVGDVTWAGAGYKSISGFISNYWVLNSNQMTMNVTLPAGPTATVWLPLLGSALASVVVTESNVVIWQNGAATGACRDVVFDRLESISPLQQYLVWSVGSGHYQFQWAVAPAPTGLTATPGHAQVNLDWQAAVSAANYNVKRSLDSGGPYKVITTSLTAPHYTDLAVTNGVTYHYVIAAAGARGESLHSYEATATPAFVLNAGFETPRLRAHQSNPPEAGWTFSSRSGISADHTDMTSRNPSAPQGVQVAFLQSGGTISQSLSHLTPGNRYRLTFSVVQQNPGGAQTWSVQLDGNGLWTFGPVGTTYADAYTDYSVLFTATAASHTLSFVGPSTGDNTVFLDDVRVTPASGSARLAAPVRLTSAAVSSTEIKLEWAASSGASGYNVKRSTAAAGPYTTIAASVSPTTYTSSGLRLGATYYYVVAATNSAGESPDSTPASATPTTEADNIIADWSFIDSHNPGWLIERGWGRAATLTPAGIRIGTVGARPPEGMISIAAPAGLSFTNAGVEMLFTAHDQGPVTRSYLKLCDREGRGLGLGTLGGKIFLSDWGGEVRPSRNVDVGAFVDGKQHALALVRFEDGTLNVYLDGTLLDGCQTPAPASSLSTIGVGLELQGGWYIPYGMILERVRAFRFASGAFNPKQLLKGASTP